jgi:tetratricopeptide (TPR) repeat protein
VKQALIRDEKHRKAFLAELQTWIDLPEHPNIVPCRFFRTVGEEIVIFADYVDGGSLADWIAKRRLTSLEQILDVAIQFAWGLHAIHERGLIHQDVKPGNVLMTTDGVPMVTDFGLARARLRAADGSFVSPALPQGQQSVLVSSGGMTPAYASPEQRAGQPLSRKTDFWSWGVSVLDMFMGGVSCPHGGHIADEVLKDAVSNGPPDAALPQLPEALVRILRQCFVADAGQRWEGIDVVALHVESLYERLTGMPPRLRRWSVPIGNHSPHDRISTLGISWANPREWLIRALYLAGRDVAEAGDFGDRQSMSKLGQAASDIACYDYALSILEKARNARSSGVDQAIAEICVPKALAHEYSADLHGSMLLVERAITTYERLMRQQPGSYLAAAFASACSFKAVLAKKKGQKEEALAAFDRAIAKLEPWARAPADADACTTLASLFLNRGTVLADSGESHRALQDYDFAIALCQPLISAGRDSQAVKIVSAAFLDRGSVFQDLAQFEEAESSFDRAIGIRESMSHASAGDGHLANAYMAKAKLLIERGRHEEGRALYEKGIAVRVACIERGRTELLPLLAEDYLNQCAVLSRCGQRTSARELAERAVGILDGQVAKLGRTELAASLANACVNAACACANLRDFSGASTYLDRAIVIYEQLVPRIDQRQREQLSNALSMRERVKRDMSRQEADKWAQEALELREAGRIDEALARYRKALALDPDDADIWTNYGAACAAANDQTAALEAFDKALELAPKNAVAWHNKGAILFQQERYAEALPALERAYALGHPSSMAAVAKCRGMLRRRSREQG